MSCKGMEKMENLKKRPFTRGHHYSVFPGHEIVICSSILADTLCSKPDTDLHSTGSDYSSFDLPVHQLFIIFTS